MINEIARVNKYVGAGLTGVIFDERNLSVIYDRLNARYIMKCTNLSKFGIDILLS